MEDSLKGLSLRHSSKEKNAEWIKIFLSEFILFKLEEENKILLERMLHVKDIYPENSIFSFVLKVKYVFTTFIY